ACADEFCSPVYEWVITEAIASGLLSAPGYFDDPLIRQAWLGASWTGRPQGQINPKDEVTAAIKRLDAGLASKTGITRELSGEDWEAIPPQRGKEKALEQEHVVEPAAPALAMNDPQSDPDAPEDES
ncbi:MAG: phage portal protein, partial [Planctomycetota bacterium]